MCRAFSLSYCRGRIAVCATTRDVLIDDKVSVSRRFKDKHQRLGLGLGLGLGLETKRLGLGLGFEEKVLELSRLCISDQFIIYRSILHLVQLT